MASPSQVAANRINCLKSQGATTPEGQAISSMNALKHGLRSKNVERLREHSYAFENRLNKWLTIGDAQSDVDEYLIYRNVSLSFDVDRAGNARLERCNSLIENADEVELTEIHELGALASFVSEPAGPTPLCGEPANYSRDEENRAEPRGRQPQRPCGAGKSYGETVRPGSDFYATAGRNRAPAARASEFLAVARSLQSHTSFGPQSCRQ